MFEDGFGREHHARRPGASPRDFIAFLLLLWLLCALAMTPAKSHGLWEIQCCSNRDCEEVPDSAINEQGDDIIVTLKPGQHPLWTLNKTSDWVWTYKRSELRKPVTGQWGVCKSPSHQGLCLYPPMRGM